MNSLIKTIENSKYILVVSHINPDFDALCSASAFYTYVLTLHKKVSFYCKSEIELYRFKDIPWIEKANNRISKDIDLIINFSSNPFSSLGIEKHDIKIVNFDHTCEIDKSSIGTTQIVYQFFKNNHITINKKMATALYIGLLKSSNNFKLHKIKSLDYKMAEDLINLGANHSEISQKIYKTTSLCSLRLKSLMLQELTLHKNGRIVFIKATKEMFVRSGASLRDTHIVLDDISSLVNVEVSLCLSETNLGVTKASICSINNIELEELASFYGGSGDKNSCEFTVNSNIEDIYISVLNKIEDICLR